MKDDRSWGGAGVILGLAFGWGVAAPAGAAEPVRFNRDVRPILAENCFACHGPDRNARKADLRLDREEEATRERPGGPAIVTGDPANSALIGRIAAADPEEVMPPRKSGKRLTPEQAETLRRWVEQGAHWEGHWAYTPPGRPPLPEVRAKGWPATPIDRFVLAALDARGLYPSLEADRPTLIRRLSFDLTGLPPTPAEVDAFVADASPGAYEALVDRLLASPHYGERMALPWLDLARYADTNGYHIDNHRDIWKYREWVIDAFNGNMTFDRFTVEQVAGDLLPGATTAQKVASGFNRNVMVNFEGGADPEEYLTKYVADRVATTATVFLGSTMACAECHDHKYDPFKQADFYRFYAFFNNVAEQGLDGNNDSPAPRMKVPTADQAARLGDLRARLARTEGMLAGPMPRVDDLQAAWEREQADSGAAWRTLDPASAASAGGSTLVKQADLSVLAGGPNPAQDVYEVVAATDLPSLRAIRLEALTDESLVGKGTGRAPNANFVLTGFQVEAAPADHPDQFAPIPLARAEADYFQADGDFRPEKAIDADPGSGWAVDGDKKREDRRLVVVPASPFGSGPGTRLKFRLRFESPFAQHAIGRFRLSVTDRDAPGLPGPVAEALARPEGARDEAQRAALRKYYRANVSGEGRTLAASIAELKRDADALEKAIPTTMVMEELPSPRETRVLMRGDFRSRGEPVSPGVPAFLPPLPAGQPANRLGLARWLVEPGNPLVARVAVNRLWMQFFGAGLVKTANDFGTQGEWPSHPELLDWLATEFVNRGWDVKGMVRLIVTSSAYRQASKVGRHLLDADPENRLLARGPRLRLDAEAIRDNALAISGLLDRRLGGPSVYPYQPPGLWEALAFGGAFSAQSYAQSHGADLYRRGLYTYWKRSSPHPSLSSFDAPNRELCAVQRPRTNTPLQALTLLNDPQYIEAARALGQRAMTEGGPHLASRLTFAFRLCTARPPKARELEILTRIYSQQLDRYRRDLPAAEALLRVGESPRRADLDPAEAAAWAAIGNVLLNLDETITRG